MQGTVSRTADGNVFEDLSGISNSSTGNPYKALIQGCKNDPLQIQARYKTHRETRNRQQKSKLLASDFSGLILDPVLQKLISPKEFPSYTDPRNCLVFWARPPENLRKLVHIIQQKLVDVAPNLWLMPLESLHMTTLEITHSLTAPEIETLVDAMKPKIQEFTDFTFNHRARLVKPMLGYDSAAIALSYLPAAGEGLNGDAEGGIDSYTYHHLRRDLYDLCSSTGAAVASRYVVPSSHLTIARFVTQKDIAIDGNEEVPDPLKMRKLVDVLEDVNMWLQKEFWDVKGPQFRAGGQWVVGEERGLECRKGTLWYGGGERIRLGKGFEVSEPVKVDGI